MRHARVSSETEAHHLACEDVVDSGPSQGHKANRSSSYPAPAALSQDGNKIHLQQSSRERTLGTLQGAGS